MEFLVLYCMLADLKDVIYLAAELVGEFSKMFPAVLLYSVCHDGFLCIAVM